MNDTLPALTLLELTDPGLPAHESYSPYCLKVHRALRLARLPYGRVLTPNPAAHRRHSPTGQVPVLLVDGVAVQDSTRILRRLEQLAPHAFAPHPEAWLWEELGDTSLSGFLVAARWADARNWPLTREAFFGGMPAPLRGLVTGRLRARILKSLVARDVWRAGEAACWEHFEALLDALEARAPERGFWLTERPSVADLSLFAHLHSLRTPLTRPQAERLAHRTRLSAWLDRVDAATRGVPEARAAA